MTSTVPYFAVCPVRFSANVRATASFFERLGLVPVMKRGGQYQELLASGGRIIVHIAGIEGTAAAPGQTHFCFITETTDSLSSFAVNHDLNLSVIDEAFGRQGELVGPVGDRIIINEEQIDDYGYERITSQDAPKALAVSMLRYSSDFARDIAFFRTLGFAPAAGDGTWWQALQADEHSGIIGLHRPSVSDDATMFSSLEPTDNVALSRIGFQTTEELDSIAERLRTNGYTSARVKQNAIGKRITVIDPDGCTIEIHSRP